MRPWSRPVGKTLVNGHAETYDRETLEILHFTFPSPRVRLFPEMYRYAAQAFRPVGRF